MMHVIPHDDRPYDIEVKLRARDWETAGDVGAAVRGHRPLPGYRLYALRVRPRDDKGGRRCVVSLMFQYIDDRQPELNGHQIRVLLSPYEEAAQLRAPLPPSPSEPSPTSTP